MRLFYFNPEHDDALVPFSPYYLPSQVARKIRHDLSLIPLWLMNKDDLLWTETIAPGEWLAFASKLFPSFSLINKKNDLACYDFECVCPWGWDVTVAHDFRKSGCVNPLPSNDDLMKIRQLSHRSLAVTFLSKLIPLHRSFIGKSFVCNTLEEVRKQVEFYPETLLKMPWSGSGRGLWRVHGCFKDPLIGWCRNVIKRQNSVIVEPYYESKVCDFALEFIVQNRQASFIGFSIFENNENGAYAKNIVAAQYLLINKLKTYLSEEVLNILVLSVTKLIDFYISPYYEGPLGIDMMILTDDEGHYCCHPCVEINLRHTMGMIALSLAQYIPNSKEASLSILFHPQSEVLSQLIEERKSANPPIIKNQQLINGCFSLVPNISDHQFHAFLEIK